jgi:signal transduction histidine kinase
MPEMAPKRDAVGASPAAAQIAHDLGNLLTPLLLYPGMIRKEVPPGSVAAERLAVMEALLRDAAYLAQQLLAVAMCGRSPLEPVCLNQVARRTLPIVEAEARDRNVAIEMDLDEPLPSIRGSEAQMVRVLQNLCRNAVLAQHGGGKVRLCTRRELLADSLGTAWVRLTVADDGPGIPDELRDRLFDPFVGSLRADGGRGCGLGLSIVREVVLEHGGQIELDSSPTVGTVFHLRFPAFQPPPTVLEVPPGVLPARVWLMEDRAGVGGRGGEGLPGGTGMYRASGAARHVRSVRGIRLAGRRCRPCSRRR